MLQAYELLKALDMSDECLDNSFLDMGITGSRDGRDNPAGRNTFLITNISNSCYALHRLKLLER